MRYKINLMNKKATPLTEKLVYFSLNYLRYIIVITQLVVIGVFFYRFQIDQKIIDLKEAVDQKKEIVQIVLPLMTEANRLDKKTIEIEKIIKKQDSFRTMFDYVMSIFPESVTLSDITIVQDSMSLTGTATNSKHLQAFYQRMKSDEKFTDVSFKNIKKGLTGYDFTLNMQKWKN